MRATMMLPIALMALIGCRGEIDHSELPPRGDTDTDIGDEIPAPDFSLSPDTIAPGEVIIAALVADDPQFDYATVEDVIFYGDVEVCASQTRADEMLISIGVAEGSPAQTADVVVLLQGGESIYMPDAVQVIEP